jgi:selenide,water dikinase
MLTRGDKNNRVYVGDTVRFNESISRAMQSALFDPQTAGGLLISLEREKAEEYISKVDSAMVIGTVHKYRGHFIEVN